MADLLPGVYTGYRGERLHRNSVDNESWHGRNHPNYQQVINRLDGSMLQSGKSSWQSTRTQEIVVALTRQHVGQSSIGL